MEESAEVIQAASKCIRFGPNTVWKVGVKSNYIQLQIELCDLLAEIDNLVMPMPDDITKLKKRHNARVKKYEL